MIVMRKPKQIVKIESSSTSYHARIISVLDASGNYAGGFFYGQNLRPANPNQCYEFNEELNEVLAKVVDDHVLNTTGVVPFFVQLVNSRYVTYVENMVNSLIKFLLHLIII